MDILKNRVAVILGVLCVILCLVSVNSCIQGRMGIDAKKKEELKRYDAEKELSKVSGDKALLEDTLRKIQQEMAQNKADLENAQKALLQEQLINKSLKNELDKVNKLKEALENDLKNALVSGKTDRPKK
ncbi:MAG: hypothetical protein MUC52_00160 [Candidatus Omnitrophica bacterium]|nr:hypothetical protein [Candidatus Omnitrophota bacterium]